ncbi:hypothetical protein GUITHDRAFT_161619 [Guillardia theta CCMP2712]|uniref:Glutathione S-transferase n=1 Tax=Guillardia theta (strain CCMP2712) TaxID=905079 RepID=L1JRP8_GUITC|nr:hypothetical protein GUITHDRAFT_161619 [Guillardia theta CCMP2712]EKX51127.1 hypothetical protein GUITHDRAFT_161619 [Guillardia theta CCMP2712]|eukprot:XP_005838107.1 hypothetical protein GUITHDRAFT_161619 [Guillardia theta CCMP2712]
MARMRFLAHVMVVASSLSCAEPCGQGDTVTARTTAAFAPALSAALLHNKKQLVLRVRGASQATMSDVTLYTNKMCPFAQKAWIALEEKKVKYDLVEISLYGSGGKPRWFLDMNPKGQVPVLKHGDKVVVESDEILKYIDQHMGSTGDLTKGHESDVAAWMKFLGSEVLPSGKALINGYGSKTSLNEALRRMEERIQGPFIFGGDFTLADIASAPFFQRMMTEQARLGLNRQEYPKIFAWYEAIKAKPSFSNTVVKSWWWWWRTSAHVQRRETKVKGCPSQAPETVVIHSRTKSGLIRRDKAVTGSHLMTGSRRSTGEQSAGATRQAEEAGGTEGLSALDLEWIQEYMAADMDCEEGAI